MKKILCLAAGLLVLNLATGLAQLPPPRPSLYPQSQSPEMAIVQMEQQRAAAIQARAGIPSIDPATGLPIGDVKLPTFDLDFKGGTPAELVKAIDQSSGKPLNVIIRPEDQQEILPSLKMNGVTVPQLFAALQSATQKTETKLEFGNSYRSVTTSVGFRCSDGVITDSSIWFFHVERPENILTPPEPKSVQYFSLSPYLDRGFTVDDITTAIQAGWKMSAADPLPELNYHKETRMLIAYGENSKLQIIQQVLQTLPAANADYWRQTDDRMKKMQDEINQLKLQASGLANPPAEKSGK